MEPSMRLILSTIILVACGKSQELATDTAVGWRPDVVCPGDAGCINGEGELSAGAAAVSITTPKRDFTDCAMASHLDLVRLARVMCEKMSVFIAILWTATELTPPAPITSTLLICASPEVKNPGDDAAL